MVEGQAGPEMPLRADDEAPLADPAAEEVMALRDLGGALGRQDLRAGLLERPEALGIGPLQPGHLPTGEPFGPDEPVAGLVPVEAEVEVGVEVVA